MAERLNNTIETQINDGNTIVSQIVDNNQPLQTVIQDVPQVQTVLQNGINVSSQINAPFVEVTSVNGKTGDVITEPVVGVFEPNHYYLKNTMISYNNNLYYAKETFTSGSSFNANDWYSVEGSQITVDSALSTTSENPVQNKVITSALNNKVNSSDLAEVATSGSFTDLINVPVFPTVNNATLTIQKNGTTINTFTANSSTNKTANIAVPTKTSEIENDSDFLATEDLFATKSGTNINFTESEGIPLSNFSIKGNTVQNGTPTPDAPVPVQTVTGENVVKISDGQGNEQSYEVNLGKNLYDKSASTDGKRLDANGGEYTDSTFTLSAYIPVEPNTKYTLSGMPGSSYGHVATYDSSKTFVGRWYVGSDPFTFTTQANARYIRIATPLVCKDSTQCEQGSQATSYAAYFEPIELCKIGTYQDYIYKSDGKWYVHKETGKRTYTADDITIAASDTYSNVRYAQFPKGADNKQYGNYAYGDIINFFTHGKNMGATPAGGWNSYISDGLIYNSAMQDNYWCSFAKSTVLATMKEKLNGMVAYYALATPTDTEITNEALIEQLEAILSQGYTYAGTNNITTVITAGNEQGELEITYPKFFSKVATASSLGSIRVGDGLDITPEGTLSTQLGFTTESTSGNTKIIKLQDGTTTSYPITTKEAILGLDDDKFDASFLYDCTLDSTAFTQEQAEALKDAILADKEILIYEVNQSTNKGQYKPYYVSASEDSAFKTINVQYINQAPAQVMFSFMSINGADWTLTVRTTPL